MSYKYCNIYKSGNKDILFNNVRIPNSFYHNAKGLLGESDLQENSGMLFENCKSIHMFGMKIPLDIVFLAQDGEVLKYVKNLKPWGIAFCFKASMTLELPVGTIVKQSLKNNMKLEIQECSKIGQI